MVIYRYRSCYQSCTEDSVQFDQVAILLVTKMGDSSTFLAHCVCAIVLYIYIYYYMHCVSAIVLYNTQGNCLDLHFIEANMAVATTRFSRIFNGRDGCH